MRLKNPGGDLAWVTVYMAVAGLILAVMYIRDGLMGLGAMFGIAALLSILVWLDQKWVALPLIVFISGVVIAAVYLLVMRGFSWRTALRIIGGGYAVFALSQWWLSRHEK